MNAADHRLLGDFTAGFLASFLGFLFFLSSFRLLSPLPIVFSLSLRLLNCRAVRNTPLPREFCPVALKHNISSPHRQPGVRRLQLLDGFEVGGCGVEAQGIDAAIVRIDAPNDFPPGIEQ